MNKGLLLPLMLFVALLSVGAQTTSKDVEVFNAPLSAEYLGVTVCLGNKIIILTNARLDTTYRKVVIQHEQIHARQIQANGGCGRFTLRYYTDVIFRLGIEIEAYCPEARARVPKMSVDGVTVALSTHIAGSYGGMEHLNLVKFLVRNCLGGLNDSS